MKKIRKDWYCNADRTDRNSRGIYIHFFIHSAWAKIILTPATGRINVAEAEIDIPASISINNRKKYRLSVESHNLIAIRIVNSMRVVAE